MHSPREVRITRSRGGGEFYPCERVPINLGKREKVAQQDWRRGRHGLLGLFHDTDAPGSLENKVRARSWLGEIEQEVEG